MYTDDSDQIISEKDKMNPRKKKKIFKKLLKTDNNESYDCTCVVSALMISILIILIINIYNLVSLYKDMDNLENIKNINTEENKNEDSNMKIYKEQKKPENPNPNNVIEENTELSRNISINLTEEIDNFVKSQRKISAKEIDDFRLLNSQNILFDKIKYRKSESPDVSIILTVNNQA